jgi:hypothetical protein
MRVAFHVVPFADEDIANMGRVERILQGVPGRREVVEVVPLRGDVEERQAQQQDQEDDKCNLAAQALSLIGLWLGCPGDPVGAAGGGGGSIPMGRKDERNASIHS